MPEAWKRELDARPNRRHGKSPRWIARYDAQASEREIHRRLTEKGREFGQECCGLGESRLEEGIEDRRARTIRSNSLEVQDVRKLGRKEDGASVGLPDFSTGIVKEVFQAGGKERVDQERLKI